MGRELHYTKMRDRNTSIITGLWIGLLAYVVGSNAGDIEIREVVILLIAISFWLVAIGIEQKLQKSDESLQDFLDTPRGTVLLGIYSLAAAVNLIIFGFLDSISLVIGMVFAFLGVVVGIFGLFCFIVATDMRRDKVLKFHTFNYLQPQPNDE
jgi:hypothetical protein